MSGNNIFNCLKFSLVIIFMLFLQVSFSQKKIAPVLPAFQSFDKMVEEKKALLGKDFSVMIAVADSIVYQKNMGEAANLKTPFSIGASSQWLTTTLILQLADEGLLTLDDTVSKYLPSFELYRRNFVTIRHCLTHQTGLGKDILKASSILDKKKYSSLDDEITDALKKEIHANAGEEFRYSNNGIVIVARIAEVVTKKRFDQIIRTKLFVPLGMRNTSFSTDDGSAPNPSGGAKSTAADMTKFLQMLLNSGKAGTKQILSEASMEEMRKVQVAASKTNGIPKANAGFSYALGSWSPDGASVHGARTTALVLPSLSGTWPEVDFSRGYAFLVFSRDFSGEQDAVVYKELKKISDQQFPVKNK